MSGVLKAILICLCAAGGLCDELKYSSMCAGKEFTCGVVESSSGGTVMCWGLNSKGQLGYGDTVSRGGSAGEMQDLARTLLNPDLAVTQVVCGETHACALMEGGKVQCWGNGEMGALGYGSTDSYGDRAAQMGANLPFVNLGTDRMAKAITALSSHTCALLDTDEVKCWGANAYGVLGFESATPVVGDAADEMGDSLPTVDVGTGFTVSQVSAGMSSTCVVLNTQAVKCWGWNETTGYEGSAVTDSGAGDLPEVDLGTDETAGNVSVGSDHTCVILRSGALKCWGSNLEGQLGMMGGAGSDDVVGNDPGEMGDKLPSVDLGAENQNQVSQVVGGNGRSYAVVKDGVVKAWGSGVDGGLGYGDEINRGVTADQMGAALPAVSVDSSRGVRMVSSSTWNHVCAILEDGAAKCWGGNAQGQLGYNDKVSRGGAPNSMGDYLPVIMYVAPATNTATMTTTSTTLRPVGVGTVLLWMGLYLVIIGVVLIPALAIGRSCRPKEQPKPSLSVMLSSATLGASRTGSMLNSSTQLELTTHAY